jgi:translationally controlled tumor-related protein
MKAVKTALGEAGKSEEEIKKFEQGASKYVKEKLLPTFKDLEFYTGESMNPDGM